MSSWEIQHDDGRACIILRDTIGIADAGRLRGELLELLGRELPVHVDCAALAHLDCAAAQVLLAFRSAMQRRQLPLTWSPLPDAPREYLTLTGLIDHLTAATAAAGEQQP